MGTATSPDSVLDARRFVKTVALPAPPPRRAGAKARAPFDFDAAKEQVAVVGSDVIAFATGITPEQRGDVVNATLLAGTPAALAVVKKTLEALQKMSADSPWITLFHRESQSANTARFQVSLVNADEASPFLISLVAFGLQATNEITQVLFFKFHKNTVKLQHHYGKATINFQVLEGVRKDIATKLGAFATEFVAGLNL